MAFKSCLQTMHLPGQSALFPACRKGRAGVGSLCLVLGRGWRLTEAGALAPCIQIPKCIPARSVRPHLGRTGASPLAWSRSWASARSTGSLKMSCPPLFGGAPLLLAIAVIFIKKVTQHFPVLCSGK